MREGRDEVGGIEGETAPVVDDGAEPQVELIAEDPVTLLNYSAAARLADQRFDLCLEDTIARAGDVGLPDNSEPIVMGVVSDDNGEEFVLVAYVPADLDLTVFGIHRPTQCDLVELLP